MPRVSGAEHPQPPRLKVAPKGIFVNGEQYISLPFFPKDVKLNLHHTLPPIPLTMARTKISSRQKRRKSTLPLQKRRFSQRLTELQGRQSQQRKVAPVNKHLDKDQNTENHNANRTDSQETALNLPCLTCTQLRAYMDSSIKSNTVEYLGPRLPDPNNKKPMVWVDLKDKNQQGLLRWYPALSAIVLVASDNALQGLNIYDKAGQDQDKVKAKVIDTLAYATRSGKVGFRQPLKELDGVVMCEHFEDVGTELEKQLSATASLMDILASRR